MAKNINSASRLYAIFSQASGMSSGIQALDIWSKIFGIEESIIDRKALKVSERLNWLNQELKILRCQLIDSKFSSDLYETSLNRLELVISPLNLTQAWNQGYQHLTPEVLTSLKHWIEMLPDEESEIDIKELKEIFFLSQELEELMESSALPDSLKTLVLHHIEMIKKALDQYSIAGVKVLHEARTTALGGLIQAKETVQQSDSEEISKFRVMWKKLNEAADFAIKSEKVVQITQKAWAFLGIY